MGPLYALPRQLDQFELVESLAVGELAEVFLATAPAWDCQVVVKCFHSSVTTDDRFVETLIAEVRAAGVLIHPNICQLLKLGIHQGTYYMVLEHVPGRSLHEVMALARRQSSPLPVEAAVHVVSEVLAGLVVAHNVGVIHHEIAPENILIRDDGEVKVNNFGLALARQQQGGILPTPYVSPEQAAGAPVDPGTDIYSAASVLHQLLGPARPDLSHAVETAMGRALQRDPAQRPTADDCHLELYRALPVPWNRTRLAELVRELSAREVQPPPVARPEENITALLDVEQMDAECCDDDDDDDDEDEDTLENAMAPGPNDLQLLDDEDTDLEHRLPGLPFEPEGE